MTNVRPLEKILDSQTKVAILRVLSSGVDRHMGGSEIARAAGFSIPSTHDSLKALHAAGIVMMELLGNQHVYALNRKDRIVQKVILPMFKAEGDWKQDAKERIVQGMKDAGVLRSVVSVILYGSVQQGSAKPGSDLDIAVIVKNDLGKVQDAFLGSISADFAAYFGMRLDAYIKTAEEFSKMLKRNSPPVSTLMKAYSVLYGKEPLEI
ncbi:MAG TPA: nucleotidyltransferase domain-containing protein [Candidatus Bathyarchaeia archaeon]|nr:nucleotidyltransferase domain-containing protein [Candidatus Bathyarchaeia archaeon]